VVVEERGERLHQNRLQTSSDDDDDDDDDDKLKI